MNVDYSRVEIAVGARRLGSGFVVKKCSVQNVILFLIMRIKPDPGCGRPPLLRCNKADAADVMVKAECAGIDLLNGKSRMNQT